MYVGYVWEDICAARAYTTVDTSAAIGGAFGGKLQDYIESIGKKE
jgi:hypothetical protein